MFARIMDLFKRNLWVRIGVTLFLSAVGSGIWELLLRPGLSFFTNQVISIGTFFSKEFSDSIYINAARGPQDYSRQVFYTGLYLVFQFPLVEALTTLKKFEILPPASDSVEDMKEWKIRSEAKLEKKRLLLITLFITALIVLVISGAKARRSDEIAVWSNQSIARLSSKISVQDERNFRSQFSSISSKKDYEKFRDDINKVSKSTQIDLPDPDYVDISSWPF
jgi:hypothetical protein